jgi:hypothetical protein
MDRAATAVDFIRILRELNDPRVMGQHSGKFCNKVAMT